MARKAQEPPAEAVKPPPPPPPPDVERFRRPAREVEASVLDLARGLGVKVEQTPRERHEAIRRALARQGKPPPRECHWTVLREYLAGRRDALAAAFAAEALGIGIKEALTRAEAGWTAAGAPKADRVPGEDDE